MGGDEKVFSIIEKVFVLLYTLYCDIIYMIVVKMGWVNKTIYLNALFQLSVLVFMFFLEKFLSII